MCKQLPTACTIHMNREALAARTPQCTTRETQGNSCAIACHRLCLQSCTTIYISQRRDTLVYVPIASRWCMVSFSAHTTHCPVVESPRLLMLYLWYSTPPLIRCCLNRAGVPTRNRDGYSVLLPVLTSAGIIVNPTSVVST